jgi:hypothetical protein
VTIAGTYTNTLTILVPAGTTTAAPATVGGTVITMVNISQTKRSAQHAVQRRTTSFTLVVTNAGPGTLSGTISDSLPTSYQHGCAHHQQREQRHQHASVRPSSSGGADSVTVIASSGTRW